MKQLKVILLKVEQLLLSNHNKSCFLFSYTTKSNVWAENSNNMNLFLLLYFVFITSLTWANILDLYPKTVELEKAKCEDSSGKKNKVKY